MKKKLQITISAVLLLTLSLSAVVLGVGKTGVSSQWTESKERSEIVAQVKNEVISDELTEVMAKSNPEERIPVCLILSSIDSESVELEALRETGINKRVMEELEGKRDFTQVEVDAYIEAERRIYSERQMEAHKAFQKTHADIPGLQDNGSSSFYASRYAPFIWTELTKEELEKVSSDETVLRIVYSPESKTVSCSNVSIPTIRANYVRDTLLYKGGGIKIGMIEATNLPANASGLFNETNITRDSSVQNIHNANIGTAGREHATKVAQIMVGASYTENGITYQGIVPNAQLYATIATNETELCQKMEWLMTQGVHVVNISLALVNVQGYREDIDGWFEHIGIDHSVHVVVAAGNGSNETNGYGSPTGNPRVFSPALAYNVITVGNIDDKGTTNMADDHFVDYIEEETDDNGVHIAWHDYRSAYYQDSNTGYSKPDISAPGYEIGTPATDDNTGTSFSAPHVAAVVAQLCQCNSTLKSKQGTVKAILAASINHPMAYEDGNSEFLLMGAGMVDSRAAFYTGSSGHWWYANFPIGTTQNTTTTYQFTVTSLLTTRVALSWLRPVSLPCPGYNSGLSNLPNIANLKLVVKDPSGNVIQESTKLNLAVIAFNPTVTGTYTIEVTYITNATSNTVTYYGLAWW